MQRFESRFVLKTARLLIESRLSGGSHACRCQRRRRLSDLLFVKMLSLCRAVLPWLWREFGWSLELGGMSPMSVRHSRCNLLVRDREDW